MAGIVAASASITMLAGDASVDNSRAGFITGEQIGLSVTPSSASYAWAITKPSGSTSRTALSSRTSATPSFTPDAHGYWLVSCTVADGAVYRLRLSVTLVSQSTTTDAIRYSPRTDASIPVPSIGSAVYYSLDQDQVVLKKPDGTTETLRGADGEQGPPGDDGAPGQDGAPGADGAGALIRDEVGTQLTSRASIRAEWFDPADDAANSVTVIRPHARLPRITVHARATVNIDVAASASTIDGWVKSGGEVLWLTAQTTPSENGFWIANRIGTALTKAAELDALVSDSAAYVHVLNGTVAGGKYFRHSASGTVELSRPNLDWTVVDIDDFKLAADGTDDLPAWNRAHDSGAGLITFYRRRRYTFSDVCLIKRKVTARGLSTLNISSATELRFNGSGGFHALFADTTPDTVGGWCSLENLWLRYTGSNLEEADHHGMNFDTPAIARSVTVQDFPGHGLHSTGGANLLRCYDLRLFQCGLSGVYIAGADSNASTFVGIDATACGKRRYGSVRAQYALTLSKASAGDVTVTANRAIWKDTRYGLYYLAKTGGTVLGNGGTPLVITVEAYDRSMEAELVALSINSLGSGTQFGYGTEYNQPAANTITTLVYADAGPSTARELMTGVVATNASGTPSTPAVLGDAHGIWDNAFLGCTWIGCHSTAPGERHFYSPKLGGSAWIGCYCEIGNFGEVVPPNIRIGGQWSDPPGMQSNGLHRDTTALRLSPSIIFTEGALGVLAKLCGNDTDEILHCTSTADSAGMKLQRVTGGRLANAWAWLHSNNQAFGITDANDARGAGHPVAPRGIVAGNLGTRISSGASLPAQSLSTDVWNVNDVFYLSGATSGQAWMHCCTGKTLVSGTTYNLTWTNALNRP